MRVRLAAIVVSLLLLIAYATTFAAAIGDIYFYGTNTAKELNLNAPLADVSAEDLRLYADVLVCDLRGATNTSSLSQLIADGRCSFFADLTWGKVDGRHLSNFIDITGNQYLCYFIGYVNSEGVLTQFPDPHTVGYGSTSEIRACDLAPHLASFQWNSGEIIPSPTPSGERFYLPLTRRR